MISVIVIQSIFAVFYLLLKKAVICFYRYQQDAWEKIKESYYWLEYLLMFTATILTPKHTYNEGIITLISVICIKVIMDSLKVVDCFFDDMFHKKEK